MTVECSKCGMIFGNVSEARSHEAACQGSPGADVAPSDSSGGNSALCNSLVAFMRAVADHMDGTAGDGSRRIEFRLNEGSGTSTLSFGYGYHGRLEALLSVNGGAPETLPLAEAAEKFLRAYRIAP